MKRTMTVGGEDSLEIPGMMVRSSCVSQYEIMPVTFFPLVQSSVFVAQHIRFVLLICF